MAGKLMKAARRTRKRSNNSVTNPQATTPIKMTAASVLGAVLTGTFDQAVSLNGVPKYTTDVVGATAIGAAMVGLNTVAITFGATIAAATEVRIPYEEPAIRNASGGFVSTSTFPV